MKVTILGCGAAAGVPMVSGGWGKCDPANHKNRRRRSSILVEEGETRLLVDSSPDLRAQLLDANVNRLDAVLYTHGHADHIHGIDELREINRLTQAPLPVYGPAEALRALKERFGYVFEGIPPGQPVFRPWLTPHEIRPGETLTIGGITVTPFVQDHGYSETIGYRCGDVAYSTDLVDLPAVSRGIIRGVKLWIVGALSDKPHPTHAHVDKVLEWIAALKPARAIITHMGNGLDYDVLARRLPVGVTPAFDGMVTDV